MEEDVEVLFESWLLKLTGLEGRSTFRISNQWKKRYFILLRQGETASLFYYNSKPSNLDETPKDTVALEDYYKVEKKQNIRGQHFVVSLTTPTKRVVVAVEDEKLYHLFAFFLQAQIKLRDEYIGECFVVRPDNSEDQRKIGARGSMCLLHVTPWGVTAALQLSKSVLVQWSLSCIRNYESTGRGQFIITVGKKATMGIGKYVFNTRLGQDNAIYDRLDRYILDAAGLRHSALDTVSQTSVGDQENLHLLTVVHPDPQFSNHLRKISRDIYDHLWQHLGSTRMKASSPDLVSDSPHIRHKNMSRTGSLPVLDLSSTPSFPRHQLPRKHSQTTSPLASPNEFSSLPKNFTRTPLECAVGHEAAAQAQAFQVAIDSQYLHPISPYRDVSPVFENCPSPPGASPPDAEADSVFTISKSPENVPTDKAPSSEGQAQHQARSFPLRANPLTSVSSDGSSAPRPRLRVHSRSCEDLIAYMEMGGLPKKANEYVYNNNTFEMDSPEGKGSGGRELAGAGAERSEHFCYSYATQDEVDRTRAVAHRLVQRRTETGEEARQQTVPTGKINHPLVRYNSLKKAMSNPNLIESRKVRPLVSGDTSVNARFASTARVQLQRPEMPLPITIPRKPGQTTGNRGGWNASTSPEQPRILQEAQGSAPLVSQQGHSKVTGSPTKMTISQLPVGISATNKTRVFRRPSTDKPALLKNTSVDEHQGMVGNEETNVRRQESTSSGYVSGNQENDVRETLC